MKDLLEKIRNRKFEEITDKEMIALAFKRAKVETLEELKQKAKDHLKGTIMCDMGLGRKIKGLKLCVRYYKPNSYLVNNKKDVFNLVLNTFCSSLYSISI